MILAGLDVETSGTLQEYALQSCRMRNAQSWITSIATGVQSDPNAEPSMNGQLFPNVEDIRAFLSCCAMQNIPICGWNTAFDVSWLIALGLRDEVMACRWLDGMLLWRHMRCAPTFEFTKEDIGFSLKDAVAMYYPEHAGYESGVDFHDTTIAGLVKLRSYNKQDTSFSIQLARFFYGQLTPQQQRVAMIEAACIPLIAETYYEGVCANDDKAKLLSTKLDDVSAVAYMKLKLSDPTISPEIIASTKQLGDKIFKEWGLRPTKFTGKGAVSTDREALAELAVQDPRASLLNEYRESVNNKTKFADGIVDSLAYNGDGRIRPAHRVYGTYTGRMTISSKQGKGKAERATGAPLHQWKRDPAFRELIEAPEGYDLVEFDFAGQEFRWMAVVSGDQTMIGLCQPGEDAHGFMASEIKHLDYRQFLIDLKGSAGKTLKPIRQLGKVANLSLQYRTSANKLQRVAAIQHGIKLSHDECEHIHATYQKSYPAVPEYWRKQRWLVKRQLYIENPMGRRVHLKEPHARNREDWWGYDSTAINFPIQSAGADQKYLALMVLRNMLPKWNARFYFELHDGLFLICPKQYTEDLIEKCRHALSNLPYKKAFGLNLPIAFPVDAKYGPSWGQLVEVP